MKGRVGYLDGIKFLLILLVISVHCIDFDLHTNPTKNEMGYYHFSTLYLMPFFVMLSGLFFNNQEINKIKQSSLRIFESYLVFQTFHVLFNVFVNKSHRTVWDIIFYQEWTLWFLISLICWRFMLYCSTKYIKNKRLILAVSIVLSLTIGFIPVNGDFLSIYRTIGHFPFFVIGYLLGIDRVKQIYAQKNYFYLLVPLLFLGICFLPYFKNYDFLRYVFYRNFPYAYTPAPNFIDFMVNVGSYIAALSISYAILKFFPSVKAFEKMGVYTLFFYLYHPVVLRFLGPILFGESRMNLKPTTFMLFVTYLLTVLIVYLLCRLKFFHWALNPISRFKELPEILGFQNKTFKKTPLS